MGNLILTSFAIVIYMATGIIFSFQLLKIIKVKSHLIELIIILYGALLSPIIVISYMCKNKNT